MNYSKFFSLIYLKIFIFRLKTMRVMTYNVLANSLITKENVKQFMEFELKYLEWNYRANLILKEIDYVAPDILCLQVI